MEFYRCLHTILPPGEGDLYSLMYMSDLDIYILSDIYMSDLDIYIL